MMLIWYIDTIAHKTSMSTCKRAWQRFHSNRQLVLMSSLFVVIRIWSKCTQCCWSDILNSRIVIILCDLFCWPSRNRAASDRIVILCCCCCWRIGESTDILANIDGSALHSSIPMNSCEFAVKESVVDLVNYNAARNHIHSAPATSWAQAASSTECHPCSPLFLLYTHPQMQSITHSMMKSPNMPWGTQVLVLRIYRLGC